MRCFTKLPKCRLSSKIRSIFASSLDDQTSSFRVSLGESVTLAIVSCFSPHVVFVVYSIRPRLSDSDPLCVGIDSRASRLCLLLRSKHRIATRRPRPSKRHFARRLPTTALRLPSQTPFTHCTFQHHHRHRRRSCRRSSSASPRSGACCLLIILIQYRIREARWPSRKSSDQTAFCVN